jgi:hypothetical protein
MKRNILCIVYWVYYVSISLLKQKKLKIPPSRGISIL